MLYEVITVVVVYPFLLYVGLGGGDQEVVVGGDAGIARVLEEEVHILGKPRPARRRLTGE